MKNLSDYSIEYALLYIQGSLLDAVTPDLRAVVFDLYKDRECLFLRFYYDGNVSEEIIERWRCSITEVSAGMNPNCSMDDQIERLDFPKSIPFPGPNAGGGYLAFLRLEPGSSKIDPRKIFHLDMPEEDRPRPETYALLATSNALLGKISAELRAVTLEIPPSSMLLNLHFFYDGESSLERIRLWEEAASEICSSMGSGYLYNVKTIRVDFPQKISCQGSLAYFRKEPMV